MDHKEISLLEILMLPDGFAVKAHPMLHNPDMGFVRNRLVEILPVLAEQLRSPSETAVIEIKEGELTGAILMVNQDFMAKTKH
jgi:hypothetical protein